MINKVNFQVSYRKKMWYHNFFTVTLILNIIIDIKFKISNTTDWDTFDWSLGPYPLLISAGLKSVTAMNDAWDEGYTDKLYWTIGYQSNELSFFLNQRSCVNVLHLRNLFHHTESWTRALNTVTKCVTTELRHPS